MARARAHGWSSMPPCHRDLAQVAAEERRSDRKMESTAGDKGSSADAIADAIGEGTALGRRGTAGWAYLRETLKPSDRPSTATPCFRIDHCGCAGRPNKVPRVHRERNTEALRLANAHGGRRIARKVRMRHIVPSAILRPSLPGGRTTGRATRPSQEPYQYP
jgi:hypothetical protein